MRKVIALSVVLLLILFIAEMAYADSISRGITVLIRVEPRFTLTVDEDRINANTNHPNPTTLQHRSGFRNRDIKLTYTMTE